ncbi:MAG: cyanophycinase [Eubacteriales bacterium]
MNEHICGNLLIIGGAEDKSGECKILKLFIKEAAEGEKICIITAAAKEGRESGEVYRNIFVNLGCKDVSVININDRTEANCDDLLGKLYNVKGIFFTGGDQLRITSMLGGTLLGKKIQKLYEDGVIIAGTSAGASAMSDNMIIGGMTDTPGKKSIRMAPGLGLLKGVIIDQHFAQRGRIGRVLTAVAMNPYVLGLGIDEDTAVLVEDKAIIKVIGKGTVAIIDGISSSLSNVEELKDEQPLAFAPVQLHILCEGYEYDIYTRKSRKQE